MVLQFTPSQFSILHMGFLLGDPTTDFEPDQMPVPAKAVEQLRQMLATAQDNSLDLTPELARVLEDCFLVGTESKRGTADVGDYEFNAILYILRRAH